MINWHGNKSFVKMKDMEMCRRDSGVFIRKHRRAWSTSCVNDKSRSVLLYRELLIHGVWLFVTVTRAFLLNYTQLDNSLLKQGSVGNCTSGRRGSR